MLPPKYYHLHYDESSGEILGFYNPMKGKVTETPTILISLEQHVEVAPRTNNFRVLNGKLVEVDDEVQLDSKPVINLTNALIGGIMIGEVCYALEPSALNVMALDLGSGSEHVRAIIHTPDGTKLVELPRETALGVADTIVAHLVTLHCG